MRFQYASYTNLGKRNSNEDSLQERLLSGSLLAVVADGLGGHTNGEIASKMAVDMIFNYIDKNEIDEDELLYAILNASDTIYEEDISGHTTVAALWLENNSAVAAYVGDSRSYQFQDNKIISQSIDHKHCLDGGAGRRADIRCCTALQR